MVHTIGNQRVGGEVYELNNILLTSLNINHKQQSQRKNLLM